MGCLRQAKKGEKEMMGRHKRRMASESLRQILSECHLNGTERQTLSVLHSRGFLRGRISLRWSWVQEVFIAQSVPMVGRVVPITIAVCISHCHTRILYDNTEAYPLTSIPLRSFAQFADLVSSTPTRFPSFLLQSQNAAEASNQATSTRSSEHSHHHRILRIHIDSCDILNHTIPF